MVDIIHRIGIKAPVAKVYMISRSTIGTDAALLAIEFTRRTMKSKEGVCEV